MCVYSYLDCWQPRPRLTLQVVAKAGAQPDLQAGPMRIPGRGAPPHRALVQDMVFAIVERESDIHIGNCALHKIDPRKKTCELGIVIGEKEYWDRGYGTDSVKILLDFALNELELSRVWLNVYIYNHRAIKVYKNCGFRLLRVIKRNHLYKGRYWDTLMMEYSGCQE